MEFNTPTSLNQMYVILNDLFYYYRVKREVYQDVSFSDLYLGHLDSNTPSLQTLKELANTLLEPKHEREIKEYEQTLNSEISKINTKLSLIPLNVDNQVQQVNEMHEESAEKIQKQVAKAGLLNSSVIIDKLAVLEQNRIDKIAKIYAQRDEEVASLIAQKTALELKLSNAQDYFLSIHTKEVNAKLEELKEKRENLDREIFKYNNLVNEKETAFSNSIIEKQSNLKLKYLDIASYEVSRDQLIEMGYYQDVIRCVSGYFDRLDPTTAYYDFGAEKKLAIYLDDYYSQMLYVYKLRAGV